MFKVGDKVVYITNVDYYGDIRLGLKLNNIYIIKRLFLDCYDSEYKPIWIEGECGNWSYSQFMTLCEHRKLKLKKLKNVRIY